MLADYETDDPYEYMLKDFENVWKNDTSSNYFDLKGNVIKNSEPYHVD